MFRYFSGLRPLGAWIQHDVKGAFEIENTQFLVTQVEQSKGFVDKYELSPVTSITNHIGQIQIDKFYLHYHIDKNKFYKLGHSDRAVFAMIRDFGLDETVKEIKEIINEG